MQNFNITAWIIHQGEIIGKLWIIEKALNEKWNAGILINKNIHQNWLKKMDPKAKLKVIQNTCIYPTAN